MVAVRREYARVKKELAKAADGTANREELYGAMQALGWIIDSDAAMSPSRAFKVKK